MIIKELEEADLDKLLALYGHMHDRDDPLPSKTVAEGVWQEIQGAPFFRYYGGFAEGILVSSCTVSVIPNLSRGCRPYGLIENVVTHRDHRRKGYGRAVLEKAMEHAWSLNCYKVMLMTGRKNEKTYRFYESAGLNRHAKQAFVIRKDHPGPSV